MVRNTNNWIIFRSKLAFWLGLIVDYDGSASSTDASSG